MATTVIDVPLGTWTLIMPASSTSYCVVNAPFGIKFKQSTTTPVLTDADCSAAYATDIIYGSATDDIYAKPAGATAGTVTRHD